MATTTRPREKTRAQRLVERCKTSIGNLSAVKRAEFWEAECRAVDNELARAESRCLNLSKRVDQILAENAALFEENKRLRTQVDLVRESARKHRVAVAAAEAGEQLKLAQAQ